MKNYYFLLLFCFTTTIATAQTAKEQLKATFEQYYAYSQTKNNEKIIEYMHPVTFKTITKAQLLEAMQKMEENPAMKLNINEMKILKMSDVLEKNGGKYARIEHTIDITMQLIPENNTPEALEEAQEIAEFTQMAFQEKYGEKNVEYDKKTITFQLNATSITIAIDDEETADWTFVEQKESTKAMLKEVLPKKIYKRFKI